MDQRTKSELIRVYSWCNRGLNERNELLIQANKILNLVGKTGGGSNKYHSKPHPVEVFLETTMELSIVQQLIRLLINSDVFSKLSKNTKNLLKALFIGLSVWLFYKQFLQKKSSY
ncbi:hypothetical protein BWI92_24035 [Flectobacillus sp. BAB-3569]|nr:hypothetical protein BWI92_24035 [Flectobacillus sp. BAB-3569]